MQPFEINLLRLRQRRADPSRDRSIWSAYEYDPEVESQGMTIDTEDGPVDMVAVERVLRGFPTPVTLADMAQIYRMLPVGQCSIPRNTIDSIARGLGVTPDAVERKIERIKVVMRNGA